MSQAEELSKPESKLIAAPALKSFNERILSIAKKCGKMEKKGQNKGQGYSYLKADDVSDKFLQARLAEDISVTTQVENNRVDLIQQDGKTSCLVTLVLSMTLTDGRTGLTVQALGQGKDPGDKAAMKAFTAAYKYCIMAVCSLSEGADPEADESTDEPKEAPSKAPKGSKSPATLEGVLAAIEAAKTLPQLEAQKSAVVNFGINSENYKTARAAFVAKKQELESASK